MLLNSGINVWIVDKDGVEVPHSKAFSTEKYFKHGICEDVALKIGRVSSLLRMNIM